MFVKAGFDDEKSGHILSFREKCLTQKLR